jgi:hypothetical protein
MSVARQDQIGVALRERVQRLGYAIGARAQIFDGISQIQAQRSEHLIIA